MDDDTQKKIAELQKMEQGMQNFLAQKQQIQSQLAENASASAELEKSEKSYKMVGNIMVAADKDKLQAELKEKKELLELKLKTIDKQEQAIREKSQALQAEVMAEMKKESSEKK